MVENLEAPDQTNQRRGSFRWCLIPATFFWVMGVPMFLVSIAMPVIAVMINWRYGLIVPNPETPARNQFALTLANLTYWQFCFLASVAALVAGLSWFKGRWKLAWIATILFFGISLASSLFEPKG